MCTLGPRDLRSHLRILSHFFVKLKHYKKPSVLTNQKPQLPKTPTLSIWHLPSKFLLWTYIHIYVCVKYVVQLFKENYHTVLPLLYSFIVYYFHSLVYFEYTFVSVRTNRPHSFMHYIANHPIDGHSYILPLLTPMNNVAVSIIVGSAWCLSMNKKWYVQVLNYTHLKL